MVLPLGEPFGATNEALTRDAVIRTELTELTKEVGDLDTYRDYYTGEQKISFGTEKFQERFGDSFEGFRDNWCQVVVDAVADRLEVIGVQIGRSEEDREQYQALSDLIWRLLQDADVDDKQADLHTGVLVEGRTTAILWPDRERGFTFHWNPAQIVRVRYNDDDPDLVDWAVKRWQTPTGAIYVTYYTPSYVWKYIDNAGESPEQRSDPIRSPIDSIPTVSAPQNLEPRRVEGEPWPLPNPFREVPVVEFLNRNGRSEIENVVPLQDAINYVWMQLMVAGEYLAFPQRVMVTKQREPSGGWHNDPGRIWKLEPMIDPATGSFKMPEYGAFPAYTPDSFLEVVREALQHVANQTKTPMRYFQESDRGGRGDAPSGESLKVEDKPLLDKVRKLSARLGNRWYQVIRLATKAVALNNRLRAEVDLPDGFSPFNLPSGEVLWRDMRVEYRSAALADATSLKALGVPMKYVLREAGFNAEEIAEIEKVLEEEREEMEAQMEEQMRDSAQPDARNRASGSISRPPQDRTGPRPANL